MSKKTVMKYIISMWLLVLGVAHIYTSNPTQVYAQPTEATSSLTTDVTKEQESATAETTVEESKTTEKIEKEIRQETPLDNLRAVPKPPASPLLITDFFKTVGTSNVSPTYKNVVEITQNKTYQAGALWFNYPIDLTRDFAMEMYVYLGDKANHQGGADGITFTMQNDPRKQAAYGSDGGGLGAFAKNKQTQNYIQNAFSIEFDTHYNADPASTGDIGNNHDGSSVPKQAANVGHIAHIFPGNYQSVMNQGHKNLQWSASNNLTDNKWHLVIAEWDSELKKLTYKYGTGGQSDHFLPVVVPIYNYTTVFGGSKVYWGFTGSTGAAINYQAVAITKLPTEAAPVVAKTVRNNTVNGNETGAFAANVNAKKGDEVEFQIKVTNNNTTTNLMPLLGATITDALPAGLTLKSWKLNNKVMANNLWVQNKLTNYAYPTVTATTNKDHAVNATYTLLVKATVGDLADKVSLTNTASVKGTVNPTKVVSGSASVTVRKPSHTLTKAAHNSAGAVVGTATNKLNRTDKFYYDITYKNGASVGFTNPVIKDVLPAGIKSDGNNIQYKLNGAAAWVTDTGNLIASDKKTLNTGTKFSNALGVKANSTLIIRIPVIADSPSVQGQTILNTATATATYGLTNGTVEKTKNSVGNLSASVNVIFNVPTMTITKQVRNVTEKLPATGYGATANVKAGDDVEFEIKLNNAGSTAAAPVFTDVLPAGLTFTKWFYNTTDKGQDGWVAATNTLTSKYATNHNVGAAVTIRVLAKVNTGGTVDAQTFKNTASVSATGVAAKSASASVVRYLPKHTLTKAAKTKEGALVGTATTKIDWPSTFYYELTYTNDSITGVTNPQIKDTLPAGLLAQSLKVEYKLNGGANWVTHPDDLISSDKKTLNTGTKFTGVGAKKTLIIRIPVKATDASVQGKTLTNTATATGKYSLLAATTVKNDVPSVSGSTPVQFKVPAMTITKQVKNVTEKLPATGYAASADVKAGDDVEFEIKIANAAGAGTMATPVFKDVLPAGLTLTKWFYNATDRGTSGWVASTRTLTDTYHPTHNPNVTITIRILAKVDSNLGNKQVLTNTASISGTGVAAKSANAGLTHYVPKHSLAKVAKNDKDSVIGTATTKQDWRSPFYYELTYQNLSDKGVTNPTIIDTLPTGLKASSRNIQFKVDNAAAWTTDTNNLISADFFTLNTASRFTGFNPKQTLTIRIPVEGIPANAASVQGKTLTNTASTTAKYSLINATTQKNQVAKIDASVPVQFKMPAMAITKEVRNVTENVPATGYSTNVEVKPGDVVEYQIKVTNPNGGAAIAPEFKDVLPAGVTLTNWTYQVGTGNITDKKLLGWDAKTNTLTNKYATNHNTNAVVTIKVTAKVGTTGLNEGHSLENTASVSATGITPVSAKAKVTPHLPTYSLEKTASKTTISLNEEFVYTLTFTNKSALASSYISPVLTDILPTSVKAKAKTTLYSLDNGTSFKPLDDKVWEADFTKLDTSKAITPAIKSGNKLVVKFTATSNLTQTKALVNTGVINGQFGLSTATTTYNIKEIKDAVTIDFKTKTQQVNLRQVIVTPKETLVQPNLGYLDISYQKNKQDLTGNNKTGLTISSSTKDQNVKQVDFMAFQLSSTKETPWLKLTSLVPEYYNYLGAVQSNQPSQLATDHVSANLVPGLVLLDYSTDNEYWVTIYVTPKLADNEQEPRPYSWSNKNNQFGKLTD